jgi:hypothetical protein
MTARVPDPVDDGLRKRNAVAEIAAGGVVNRIHVHRSRANLRAERVDERLSDPAHPWRFTGTPGEHHFHVRARLGGRNRDRRAEQRRRGQDRGTRDTEETSDSATGHD